MVWNMGIDMIVLSMGTECDGMEYGNREHISAAMRLLQ